MAKKPAKPETKKGKPPKGAVVMIGIMQPDKKMRGKPGRNGQHPCER